MALMIALLVYLLKSPKSNSGHSVKVKHYFFKMQIGYHAKNLRGSGGEVKS